MIDAAARSVTGERILELCRNVEAVVRGKSETVQLAVTALLARGHLLLEDVPGVGKTTLARALARSIDGTFRRIQLTSDMLPSDLLGVSIWDAESRRFEFHSGPIFGNVILADELNRAMPKTQGALLEAMSERNVSIDGTSHALPQPFLVLATQNPADSQGTFPLPESQLDRFLMRLPVGYPDRAAERIIIQAAAGAELVDALSPVLSTEEVSALQAEVDRVRAAEPIVDYVLALVEASRNCRELRLGVSPRGAQVLFRAAKARALVEGRSFVVPEDVSGLAVPVFAHRVLLADSSSAGWTSADAEEVIRRLVASVDVPI